MPDQGYGSVDGEAKCRSAGNVQREVSAYVDAGEGGDRHGGGNDGAPGRAQSREGSRAQGDCHTRVPGQVPEPGSIAAAAVCAADQCRWPGPAYHLFDQLGQGQVPVPPASRRPASARS
jgi:hypothetical protein